MSFPNNPFPGRPEHPDMMKLSESILWIDGEATEGGRSAANIAEEIGVDLASVIYMAEQRIDRGATLSRVNLSPAQRRLAQAAYMEAVLLGYRVATKAAQ